MGTEAVSPDSSLYAICQECEWYSAPGGRDHADAWEEADAHATRNANHTISLSRTSSAVEEAKRRARKEDREEIHNVQ